jgi:hypothetical protein
MEKCEDGGIMSEDYKKYHAPLGALQRHIKKSFHKKKWPIQTGILYRNMELDL